MRASLLCGLAVIGGLWLVAATSAAAGDLPTRAVVSVLPEWPPGEKRQSEPEGSGVVIGDGRTIVTARHVVAKALSIRVRTVDGRLLAAKLKGADKATDLALLRIEQALEPIRIVEEDPALGQRVCAIGNNFGLGLSVSCGVVSGVHRAGVGFNPIEDFVQTDSAINPGGSGGALVDEKGRLVGTISAIFTKRSDANVGVNFAVSAALVRRVADALMNGPRVPWLTSGLRLVRDPKTDGTGTLAAKVVSAAAGFAGARAGLMPGDRIVEAAGRRIRKPADFKSVIARHAAPADIPVLFERDGALKHATLSFR